MESMREREREREKMEGYIMMNYIYAHNLYYCHFCKGGGGKGGIENSHRLWGARYLTIM